MVYREAPFSAKPLFFPKSGIRGFETAGYLESRRFVKARGMKLASHKLMEEHIERCPGYGPMWEREMLAYPEGGKVLRCNHDVKDVHGWVLPGSYVPEAADKVPRIALAIDPGEIEEFRGKTVIHPARISILQNFPQSERSGYYLMPNDLFSDSGASGRSLFRYWAGGVRPLLRRIYGGMANLSADYSPYSSFAIVAEEPMPTGPAAAVTSP